MKSLTITLIIFEFGVLSIVIDLATADCQPMTVQNPKLGRYDISADGCQHCDDEYTLRMCENGAWNQKGCPNGCEITTKCNNHCKWVSDF